MSNNAAVNKLLEELNNKIAEIREAYSALQTLKKYGASFDLPDLGNLFTGQQGTSLSSQAKIRPDEFYGRSQTEATEMYLRKAGHAMPLGDIYNALSEGGIAFGGDGKKNLNIQLTRATRKFSKIGSGPGVSFGLLEWYPKKKKVKINDGAEAEEHETDNDNFTETEEPRLQRRTQTINPVDAGNSSSGEENKS